jgi:hypothetical protein
LKCSHFFQLVPPTFFLASIQIGATHLSEDFQSPALAGLHDWDGHATGKISIASIQIGATHLSQ